MFRPAVLLVLVAGATLGATPDSRGVTVDPGGTLLHRSAVEYPREAISSGIAGVVIVELDLDKSGEVADARVVSGPEELRRAALRSVLDWHYSSEATPHAKVQATIAFKLDEEMKGWHFRPGDLSCTPPSGTVRELKIEGLTRPAEDALVARLPLHVGDTATTESLEKARETTSDFDRHLSFSFETTTEGTLVRIGLRGLTEPFPAPQPGAQQICAGSNVQAGKLITSPQRRGAVECTHRHGWSRSASDSRQRPSNAGASGPGSRQILGLRTDAGQRQGCGSSDANRSELHADRVAWPGSRLSSATVCRHTISSAEPIRMRPMQSPVHIPAAPHPARKHSSHPSGRPTNQ